MEENTNITEDSSNTLHRQILDQNINNTKEKGEIVKLDYSKILKSQKGKINSENISKLPYKTVIKNAIMLDFSECILTKEDLYELVDEYFPNAFAVI